MHLDAGRRRWPPAAPRAAALRNTPVGRPTCSRRSPAHGGRPRRAGGDTAAAEIAGLVAPRSAAAAARSGRAAGKGGAARRWAPDDRKLLCAASIARSTPRPAPPLLAQLAR
jgi:hypothetical protein